jgi:2-polyprenyl-3-methyl-5-hydroxy-6-metoxy-1,4-benzoquinol methylase
MMGCICCGAQDDVLAFVKNGFDIRRCRACGLGRTLLKDDFDPSSYYDESYFQGGAADGYADYLGSAETLRTEFRHTLREIMPFLHGGRLLEFGCAYGFFLEEVRPHFDSVHGVEYSEAAASDCRRRGLDVRSGEVSAGTLSGTYDAVVGLDVIEHVPEPQETVRTLARHMNQNAVLVMTTGDWSSWLARATGTRWRLMTPPQHLSFFTPTSMRAMLEGAGLRVVSLTHPWKRVPASLIAYQLQRMAGLTPRPTRALNRLSIPVNLWDAMRVVAVRP